jgi:toxin FitB
MSAGRRREALAAWLQNDLYFRFERRILPIDYPIAEAWGVVMSRARKSGAPLNPMDAFLAATAQIHSLTLVTRNTRHFAKFTVPLFNPWQ